MEEGQATVSVFDHGLLYGDGVFQLVGIWGGRLFALREHLDYLRENAAAIFLTLPYDEERLVSLCEETCGLSGLKRGVLRVMLTRGEGSLGISIRSCKEPILIIVPHACEEAVYVDPLDIVTVPLRRNSVNAVSPMVKSLNGLNEVLARMEALGGGYQEGVLLNQEGFVTSCASSSLFIVRSGTLYTSALSAGVPREVMRGKVLELAATLGIPCQEVL